MVLTLANMCKYDETILLDKMAEETSLLEQAFAETGVQLDRIIDAYERTPTVSNYPRYISFIYDSDIPTIYQINEDLSIECIEGYGGDSGVYCKEENNSIIIMDCYSDIEHPDPTRDNELFKYDKTTFELTNLYDSMITNLHWLQVDTNYYPRTLQTMFDHDILKQFIVLSPNEIQVVQSGDLDGQELWNLTNGVLSYCEGHDNVPTDSVCSFDLTTFEITELDLGYQSQWINS